MARVIDLKTAIPGPQSLALAARRARAVPKGVPATTPLALIQADNAVVTDADGNRLIDFGGGIGVVNAGPRHPKAVQAVRDQLDHFTHVCFPVSMYEPYIALAEQLNALTPGTHEKRTFFVNSGAEAVENAIKAARKATGRQGILCFEHAFHGRTYLGMSLTSKVNPYKNGFGPFMPEVYRIPFPYCYRCDTGPKGGACCMASRERLEQLLASHVDPKSLAAVIIELEVGEGGFIPVPPDYLAMLAQFCKDHGIVFIADEIQTGFGRTGKLFACEHYGLVPDIITTAKSLAGGLPLAAVTGRAEILDAAQPGGLGGTYGGNPIACAAALAVIRVMQEEKLPERAAKLGATIRARFEQWRTRFPEVGDVRGLGAMIAIELVKDKATKETFNEEESEKLLRGFLSKALYDAGLYCRDTVEVVVGVPTTLVADPCQTLGNWTPSGGAWNVKTGDPDHLSAYLSDSPMGVYPPNYSGILQLTAPLNLSQGVHAWAFFEDRYAFEQEYDAGLFETSTDGVTWTARGGNGAVTSNLNNAAGDGKIIFGGTRWRWRTDRVDLSPLTGATAVRLRWRSLSDSGVEFDGMNFDSLRVCLYDPALQPAPAAVSDGPAPERLAFAPPTPNPARGVVTLSFATPDAGAITLQILDVQGRTVRSRRETLAHTLSGAPYATHFAWNWDLCDASGRRVAPGLYLVRLATARESVTRRVVVLP